MASSQETFNKKEKEKKRLKKRLDKQKKLADRKANSQGGGGNMIAYVDENGQITDTPPNPTNRKKIDAENIIISVPKREMEEISSIRKGKVEFFNHSKGFGFIKEVDTQEKYFVHVNALTEEIAENDMVTFEIERSFKGMNAVRVKKV
ncbi:MAG: cold shock domain-containing protein [Bacteroidetes bacterium]|nr:MAG: cold shock domain-containing protein [Bacteroidota bacterium]